MGMQVQICGVSIQSSIVWVQMQGGSEKRIGRGGRMIAVQFGGQGHPALHGSCSNELYIFVVK